MYRAIRNFYVSDEYYPSELRHYNATVIPTLYKVPVYSGKCPADHGSLVEEDISLQMLERPLQTRKIRKCRKCSRKFITISRKNALLVKNYLVSNQYAKRIEEKSKNKNEKKKIENDCVDVKKDLPQKKEPTKKQEKVEDPKHYGLPESSIVTVYFSGAYQAQDCYTIVKRAADENNARGIFYLNRSTAQRILQSVLFNVPIEPGIKRIVKYPQFYCCKENMVYFCDVNSPKSIMVYNRRTILPDSDIEVVTAFVLFAGREEPIPISVYYNSKNQRYFINEVSYRNYMFRYGLPYFYVQPYGSGQFGDWNLRTNSELNLFGYSVSQQSGITRYQRQTLLEQLIDSGLMSKARIMGHLEWLISTRQGNPSMSLACKAWADDLEHVSKYRMKNQRVIWGKLIGHKFEVKKDQYRAEWIL